MVFVVEKWEDIEECVRYARYVLYQVIDLGDVVELRVKTGKLGWLGVFKKESSELQRILRKLKDYGAIRVLKSIPDENFLS
ncbi:MAG: hypothetical protein DRN04_11645 [Thermoprotei archaeon]|nr:MAG: hypothetical protein DRN04_11645 [Thermoprotei archaeon]